MWSKFVSGLAWLSTLLAGLLAVFYAGKKTARDAAKLENERAALELQQDADTAIREGLQREQKKRDEIRRDFKRVDLD